MKNVFIGLLALLVTSAAFAATTYNVDPENDGYVNGQAEVYGSGWNGDPNAPTKNDVYDSHDALKLNTLTAVPASPVAGEIYKANGTTWDPAGLAISKVYYTLYDGSSWIALVDEDGVWYLAGIDRPTLELSELIDTSGDRLLVEDELKHKILSNGDASGTTNYDFPTRGEGWDFYVIIEAAYNVTMDPNGTEQWYMNGTQGTSGQNIQNTSPTVGETIHCMSTERAVYCVSTDADWDFE